jgi:hypothetical protein
VATSTGVALKTMEDALKCRTPRYSPRVHMIKLTQQLEITPYKWVHPDDDR